MRRSVCRYLLPRKDPRNALPGQHSNSTHLVLGCHHRPRHVANNGNFCVGASPRCSDLQLPQNLRVVFTHLRCTTSCLPSLVTLYTELLTLRSEHTHTHTHLERTHAHTFMFAHIHSLLFVFFCCGRLESSLIKSVHSSVPCSATERSFLGQHSAPEP